MNLHSVFEELNKLYESVESVEEKEVAEQEVVEEAVEQEPVAEQLTEAADEEEIEIVEDEEVEEEAPVEEDSAEAEAQFVLECANCGGLMIKVESDVNIDEETGLANADDVCQYCEAADGHKVIGTLTPFAAEEPAAEEVPEEEVVEDEAPVED